MFLGVFKRCKRRVDKITISFSVDFSFGVKWDSVFGNSLNSKCVYLMGCNENKEAVIFEDGLYRLGWYG